MKHWTEAEKKSARLRITITYRSRKVKYETKPVSINIMKMNPKDYKTISNLINKYGKAETKKA